MDQVHVVRHKVLVDGQSVRRVAREMELSRNTVKRYLEMAAPVRVEHVPRGRPVWEKVGARIEALLSESPRWTGGKQRLTATRLHQMLVGEGLEVGVTTVKDAVAEWKRRRREVFVPLVYPAGDLAEVDFFEVLLDLDGKRHEAEHSPNIRNGQIVHLHQNEAPIAEQPNNLKQHFYITHTIRYGISYFICGRPNKFISICTDIMATEVPRKPFTRFTAEEYAVGDS